MLRCIKRRDIGDFLIRQALRDLRTTLAAVERVVGQSGVLAVGPNRERTIQSITAAVAKSVQDSFGVPQLAALQEALAPFVEQQLAFARRMVTMAGGNLSAPVGVAFNAAQVQGIVNAAVVGGKTLSTQLTQTLPATVADRVERFIRLGLSDLGGETFATYEDAVVRTTARVAMSRSRNSIAVRCAPVVAPIACARARMLRPEAFSER